MPNIPKAVKNPYLRKVMDDNAWETIEDMHLATGIAKSTLFRYADNIPKAGMQALIDEANAIGVDPGDWILGISGLLNAS